ncbi:hypothetical protein F4778DRAFT_323843 [Xylariomycetidae sp. FL2044]|nr:hypothetical protein F4778DRAFT_323843 [Xylariomycetidae sp. FL2044]
MSRNVSTVDLSNTSSAYYAPATIGQGRFVHVAGQPGSTKSGHVPADYESQIHLALLNLRKIIVAAGASVRNIAKLTLFIVGYDAANRLHTRHVQRFLAGHRPAITLIPVPKLAVDSWLFEVDAVLALPETPAPAPKVTASGAEKSVDVVIIGAGLAGLTAAHDVLRAGLSCVVLEARDRVGGKTWSTETDGGKGRIDLGAGWINDTNQSKVYQLAKRYGAEVIVQNTDGKVAFQDFDGKCSTFEYGELPQFDAKTREGIAQIRDMTEADCQAVDVWKPANEELDAQTFEAYLRARGASKEALATASVWTRAMLGQEPRDISALYFLNYCVSGGGLLQMRSDRKDGGQYLRIRQGTQHISLGLAGALPEDVVRLSTPVQAIVQEGRSARVQAGGVTYSARKVISTVPGPALKTIAFEPRLPPAKLAWIDSLTYGYYTKALMEFKSPFWVKSGFCGLAQSFSGPAGVIRDTVSPKDGTYVLTCFMGGDPGKAWSALSDSDRVKTLLKQLGALFQKEDIDQEFVKLHTYEWSKDEYSGWGCPCTSLTPGALDALGGDIGRRSVGNVHFAGTEVAGEWKGYMEGAIRSGERAAAEVVEGLDSGFVARL